MKLWSAWFRWTTLGETAGFFVPALTALIVSDARPAVAVPVLVVAGMAEGSVLGLAQAHVLKTAVRDLSGRLWVLATALAAGLAWLLGLLPSALSDRISGWPTAVVVTLGIVGGLVLLLSIGVAQAMVLRRHRWLWVAGTTAGWLAGLMVFSAVAMPLWRPGQPGWLVVLIGVFGGLLMAATVAAITGRVVVRLPAG